jgi:alpha-L-arabinofuranosidase
MVTCRSSLLLSASLIAATTLFAQPSITVQTDKPGHALSPTLWGLFFEEINHAGDGGLYAELIENRSFEDAEKPEHWEIKADGEIQMEAAIDDSKPLNPYNRRSLRVAVKEAKGGRVTIANDGFWGISLKQGENYRLSVSSRGEGGFAGPVKVTLEGKTGAVLAQGSVGQVTDAWKAQELVLTATGTDPAARLVLTVDRPGSVWLDMVSLFPEKTWKGRKNGLRADLAGMLDGLKPSFVRFPGGCWVEGHAMSTAYRWKETIGDISQRRNQRNLWQYYSTHGLGYLEYLIMCEDLGAEPLFVINCGMSHSEVVPMDQMGPFVQDALDAIEYANGPVTSVWGGMRARHGHPAPFHLQFMEIGNENGGPAYHERYALMYRAIKAKYPEMRFVANEWGGVPTNAPVEIIDEHYYNTPEFFLQQADRYDSYDRKGPKIYVGEYAVTQNSGQGHLRAAIGEAAFMTGMERNSDVVIMASYAPLFVQVNDRRWNPDLINFDSARSYGLPSYYVQKLFSENRGDVVLPVTVSASVEPAEVRHGGIGLGTWQTRAEYKDAKVTVDGKVVYEAAVPGAADQWKPVRGQWTQVEGAYRQGEIRENCQALAGDRAWSNYTYEVKARKLGGDEGFLVMFHVQDEQNWVWWNLGGWNNREHALESCVAGGKGGMGNHVPGSIETGRWYDIRIELKDGAILCLLDGKLIHDTKYPQARPLFASATRVKKTGEVLLKVVNASAKEQAVALDLRGITKLGAGAKATVLTSANPTDENSLEQPTKVAPVTRPLDQTNPRFTHTFPGNSFTVFRLPTK